MTDHTIKLDCPPGDPRPYDLIESIIEGTGLTLADFDADPHPFYGMQSWRLKPDVQPERYLKAKPTIEVRIKALYEAGTIRAARF